MTTQISKRALLLAISATLILGVILIGTAFVTHKKMVMEHDPEILSSQNDMKNEKMSVDHGSELLSANYNKEVGVEVEAGIKDLLSEGRYKCCLEKPCSYCFVDKEHQDRELVCDCLVDIMNGKAPCGECSGKILEGGGNALIAEYFATSLSEEVGEKHLGTFQEIISDIYGIPVVEQL